MLRWISSLGSESYSTLKVLSTLQVQFEIISKQRQTFRDIGSLDHTCFQDALPFFYLQAYVELYVAIATIQIPIGLPMAFHSLTRMPLFSTSLILMLNCMTTRKLMISLKSYGTQSFSHVLAIACHHWDCSDWWSRQSLYLWLSLERRRILLYLQRLSLQMATAAIYARTLQRLFRQH